VDNVAKIVDSIEADGVSSGKEIIGVVESCSDENCRCYGAEDAGHAGADRVVISAMYGWQFCSFSYSINDLWMAEALYVLIAMVVDGSERAAGERPAAAKISFLCFTCWDSLSAR